MYRFRQRQQGTHRLFQCPRQDSPAGVPQQPPRQKQGPLRLIGQATSSAANLGRGGAFAQDWQRSQGAKGASPQVPQDIGHHGHRQRHARRAGAEAPRSCQNRHHHALCHGQPEQRETVSSAFFELNGQKPMKKRVFLPPNRRVNSHLWKSGKNIN